MPLRRYYSIDFTALTSPVVFGVAPITLVATGGASGNPVVFSVLSGPGTISSGKLTVTGAGTMRVAANQAGNTNYTAATQVPQSLTVNKATPLISPQSSTNPALIQTSIALSATVSAGATATATFLDGTTPLGTNTITAGVATLATSTLTAGSRSITALYSGDTNFTTLTSSTLTEAVDDFNLTLANGNITSLTVLPGGTAVFTLTMSPVGATTFPAAVTLSLTGQPDGATSTFSPVSLPAGSGTTIVTLTIQIPQTSAMALPIRVNGLRIDGNNAMQDMASRGPGANSNPCTCAPFALAFLLLPFAGRARRVGKQLGRAVSVLLLIVAALTATIGLSGCGASGSGYFAQSPKSYTLTVTETSGAVSRSTNLTLTVE